MQSSKKHCTQKKSGFYRNTSKKYLITTTIKTKTKLKPNAATMQHGLRRQILTAVINCLVNSCDRWSVGHTCCWVRPTLPVIIFTKSVKHMTTAAATFNMYCMQQKL